MEKSRNGWSHRGARHLILPDRRDEPRRRAALIGELESEGAAIEVVVLDLADAGQVAAYCDQRQKEPHQSPIRGVIYCAGRSHSQLAAHTDHAAFHDVFASKVAGA